ncbi:FecCD family ABC transporter permease [Stackebrandtia soli]|uniref:FecCD family ABC transporter permease n=1 Tax=Stackebrandtia soli TaxID=1892856 RepID=UPI0039ED5A65
MQRTPLGSRHRITTAGFSILAFLLLCGLSIASMVIGGGDIGIPESIRFLLDGGGDSHLTMVMVDLRLPRTLVALLAGAALGLAGCLLQSATRNPLAETGLLGVNAGAALGVVAGITFLATDGALAVLGFALLGAFTASGAVLLIAAGSRARLSPLRLILAGVALSATFRGLSSFILMSSAATYDSYRFWVLGSLSGVTLEQVVWVGPALGVGVVITVLLTRPLGALGLGDDVASALGHSPKRTRAYTTIAVTLLTGAAVSLCGPIGFLGLLAPFAARALVGPRLGAQLALSAVAGAAIMIVADLGARLVLAPYEAPVSVLLAAVGGPLLILIVRSSRMLSLRVPGGAA